MGLNYNIIRLNEVDSTNIYAKNNSSSDIIFSIKRGTLVKGYPIGEWYYIEYNNQKGFVNLSLSYVEVSEELDSEKNFNEPKLNISLEIKEIITLLVSVVITGGIVIFTNKKKKMKKKNTMISDSDFKNNNSNNNIM